MAGDRWADVRPLFFELVELDREARAAFLTEFVGSDPELHEELQRLLAAHDRADALLETFDELMAQAPDPRLLSSPRGESPASDPHGLIGGTISHYEVEELLGAGGMGVLYRAVDTRLARTVALKFLPPQWGFDAAFKQRFHREARAAAVLDHANICTIHEIGEADQGQLFIAMAFYEGETVRDRIARGPLTLGEALDLACQTLRGLTAAHEAGLVHRDIKPANLIVTDSGVLKILDFGLAKTDDTALTEAGLRLGTLAYMSPEQTRGDEVDERTDLWSLGVVLYEMLTGRQPFRADSGAAVIQAIRSDEPDRPGEHREDLSADLETMVLGLLSKDPADRPEMAQRLGGRARLPPQSATVTRGPDRSGVGRPKWRRAVIGGVAASLLLGGVAVGWRMIDASPEPPTVAVLPFENRSVAEVDAALFADGLHDQILTQLSRIPGVRVTSRTSVMEYRGANRNVREIADSLGVDFVVEGGVQRAGDEVQVNIQLIDAEVDEHRWANTYTESFTVANILAIQADVAERIARALGTELAATIRESIRTPPTLDEEAYDLYVRGLALLGRSRSVFTVSDARLGLGMFERAVEMDPSFALARLSAALSKIWLHYLGADRTGILMADAKQTLDEVLLEHPDMPEAHNVLGNYYYHLPDYPLAIEAWTQAEALAPGAFGLDAKLADVYRRQGRWNDALDYRLRQLDLDPRSANTHVNLALSYFYLRRYDEALAAARRSLALDPASPYALRYAAKAAIEIDGPAAGRAILEAASAEVASHPAPVWMMAWLDQWEDADHSMLRRTELLADELTLEGSFITPVGLWRSRSMAALGRTAEAHAELTRSAELLEALLQEQPEDDRAWGALGTVYAALGREEEAIEAALHGTELMPMEVDARFGLWRIEELALVYTWTGHPAEAVEQLEYLLSVPSELTRTWLANDPRWDPLRGHADFETLLGRDPRSN